MFPGAKRFFCFAVCVLLFGFHLVSVAGAASRPNVIVIVADDLGWPDLGVMGATDLVTPHIDSLATNGVRFMNAYVSAPICSPSRAGLITGRYQQRFGHEINPGPQLERNSIFGVPLTQATVGNRMKELGYATGWIGKSHLGGAPEYHPLQRGFDQFYGFIEGHHEYIYPYDDTNDPILRGTAEVEGPIPYLTSAFQAECVNFIRAHTNEPFFLYAPFNAIHFPLQAEAKHFEGLDRESYGTNVARYAAAAMLRALDDAVGDILTNLTQLNLLTNTVIFFTSDNGAPAPTGIDRNGSSNGALRGFKGSLYEGGVRAPFLVQWAGQIAPRVDSNTVVTALDIVPTAIAAGGGVIQPAWKLDGQNLLPFLRGQGAGPERDLFWRMETAGGDGIPPGPLGMRSGDWKMVKPSRGSAWELYDLPRDISETNNLADLYPDVVQRLMGRFATWDSQNARPLWDFNTTNYLTPEFIREDIRVGAADISYFAPEFLPGSDLMAFQNGFAEIWLGNIDPRTANFVSTNGHDQRVDARLGTNDRLAWGISTNGPALFYSKGNLGSRAQIWRARASDNFAPTQLTFNASFASISPRATQNPNDPTILINYTADTTTTDTNVWTYETNVFPRPVTRGLPSTANSFWIPNTRRLVYAGFPTAQSTVSQLIHLDTTTGITNLITTGAENKTDARAFVAAELGGELLFAGISARTNLSFYRGVPGGGFSNIVTLAFPAAAKMPYIFSLEPLRGTNGFNGVSYFCFAAYQNNNLADPGDSSIWVVGLGPNTFGHLIRRVDNDPLDPEVRAHPGRRDPKFYVGDDELFVFYSQYESNVVQLRRARTGIKLPDYRKAPTGFTDLQMTRSMSGGEADAVGRPMNNTETTALVAHEGWLFAGQGSFGARDYPIDPRAIPTNWSGAQILVKTSSVAPWRVDYNRTDTLDPFPIHLRVESLQSLQIADLDGQRSSILLAGMSDITSTGAIAASVRLRAPDGEWKHSHVTTATEEAYPTAFASHKPGFAQFVFTGLSNGQVHRGTFNGGVTNIVWNQAHEFRAAGSAISGFAEVNSYLYAAAGLAQASNGAPVTGGIFIRADSTAEWFSVYRPPFPTNVFARAARDFLIRGLTSVRSPDGAAREMLVFARWPGVIERVDPIYDYLPTIEVDLRDFLARNLGDESIRGAAVTAAYSGMTAATNPISGELVHLIGIWVEREGRAESHFVIRHSDASYELAVIPNLAAGTELRATRAIAVSPFAEDAGAAFYFGGYDAGDEEAHDTAWIQRGDWLQWPEILLSQPAPPQWQLSWPATSTDWLLERTVAIPGGWQPVGDFVTRSTSENAISVEAPNAAGFYRLRRP